jgi:hypothetical protein
MSCFRAYDGERPAGFKTCALTLLPAAWLVLYMQEIAALASACNSACDKGFGRAPLAGFLERAEAECSARLDWQADRGNTVSQAFYSSIGAPEYEKKTYRIMAADFDLFRNRLVKNN